MTLNSLEHLPSTIIIKLLENLDWNERNIFMCLTKKNYEFSKSDMFFIFCCELLSKESAVYSCGQDTLNETWKSRFKYAYQFRNLWSYAPKQLTVQTLHHSYQISDRIGTDIIDEASKKFKINVFARFRPVNIKQSESHSENDKSSNVNLPLHQRLALIKLSNNLKSNKDALKILIEEGNWFDRKWNDSSFYSLDAHANENKELRCGNEEEDHNQSCGAGRVEFDEQGFIIRAASDKENNDVNTSSNDGMHMVASIQVVDPVENRIVVSWL